VVIPILPRLGWDEVREFSRLLAECWRKRAPISFTAKMAKQQRTRKVFVDYLRNADTAKRGSRLFAARRGPARRCRPRSHGKNWTNRFKSEIHGPQRPAPARTTAPRPLARLFHTRQSITAAMRRALGAQ